MSTVSTQLAYDLASGLWEKEIVLQKYGMSEPEWERVRQNPRFQQLVKEAYEYWNGQDGIERRIRAKARVMLEESLPTLHRIATSQAEPAAARLGAIKQIENLSGVSAQEAAGAGSGGPSFRIQINLGEQMLSIAGKTPAKAAVDYEEGQYVEDAQEVDGDE